MSDLNNDLRQHINNKWTHLVKEKFCEKCGEIENLEVHHEDRFVELLDETLVLLNLDYKRDTNAYSDKELEIIRLVVQGKHLEVKSQTLCLDCHNKLHSKENKKQMRKKLEKIADSKPDSKYKLMKILDQIQVDDSYKEQLLKDGIINERGITKKNLRELSGFVSRTTFSQILADKEFVDFLEYRNIIVPEKGHYVQL